MLRRSHKIPHKEFLVPGGVGVFGRCGRLVSALLKVPLLALIHLYRLAISPMLPRTCRFEPSCSAYAIGALKRHGFVKGIWLAVRRIIRCRPGQPGGYDPVP